MKPRPRAESVTVEFEDATVVVMSLRAAFRLMDSLAREGWRVVARPASAQITCAAPSR